MKQNDMSAVADRLQSGQRFRVVSHVNPDGDAVGSLLAMRELLLGLGKRKIDCVLEGGAPYGYQWLPGADHVLTENDADDDFDTLIYLDCSCPSRAGKAAPADLGDAAVVVIDHHLEDSPCGDVNFVDATYAATGEMIVDLFEHLDVPLTDDGALCAYVAIATDTGGFRFSNTTARTHRLAARLVDCGLPVSELSERLFENMTLGKFNLMARVLGSAVISDDGRVVALEVREKDLEELGATSADMDGIINYPRHVETVEVAIIFKEISPTATKISVRSRETFNAADFCKQFNGGGHAAAAGALIEASVEEARTLILKQITAILGGAK
jgi:phosphoesterase RecJ-like protein